MQTLIIILLAMMLAGSFINKKPKRKDYDPIKNNIGIEKVAVDMKWKVCPKVGLKDLFEVTSKENYMNYFGRISQKHIDFLICNEKLQPVYAIELDDSSHKGREESDRFKDEIFKKSSIPLIRIKAQKDYSKEYILRNIASKVLPS